MGDQIPTLESMNTEQIGIMGIPTHDPIYQCAATKVNDYPSI